MIIFNNRLKELRLKNNMTQEELGNHINTSKVSICLYEKGSRMPSIDTLINISELFKVDIDYLLGRDTYIVSDNMENYGTKMSKEEINLIRELRRHPILYEKMLYNTKRTIELIEKKIY